MMQSVNAISDLRDSRAAGRELGANLRAAMGGAKPDAVIVFASAQHDYEQLLAALADASGCQTIVGASSAGEFTQRASGEGQAAAMAIRSERMRFRVGLGQSLSVDPGAAARSAAASFQGRGSSTVPMPYRYALVLVDALAGHTEALVEELTLATGGDYSFFGGGAGDDGAFRRTHVFSGVRAYDNAVVALEILTEDVLGIGVAHGWQPAGPPLRATEVDGMRLVSLNGAPAVQIFEAHAAATNQVFDADDPMPFFLNNVLGVRSGAQYRLRVPLNVYPDGAVGCAAAVAPGSVVCLMRASEASTIDAARVATRRALGALGGRRPAVALVFDCVATRLRLGRAFDDELQACASLLEPAAFVGCNTYGQIARAEGQFGGFHNCTAVVCALPQGAGP